MYALIGLCADDVYLCSVYTHGTSTHVYTYGLSIRICIRVRGTYVLIDVFVDGCVSLLDCVLPMHTYAMSIHMIYICMRYIQTHGMRTGMCICA